MRRPTNDRTLELWKFQTLSIDMQQIKLLPLEPPGGADTVVAQLRVLVCRIPALKYDFEFRRLFSGSIELKPLGFYHAAARRRRLLLVLSGDVVFSDGAAYMLEHRHGFALRVQGFAGGTVYGASAEEGTNNVGFLFFGDGWQSYMFPLLLLQDMADQIVLVQALHKNDDAAGALVIEPSVKGVIVPVVGRLALGCRERLIGLQRVINNDDIGAPSR